MLSPALADADTPLYIDGAWRAGSGSLLPVINPSTEQELASIQSADRGEVEIALASAATAQPAWARAGIVARGAVLRDIADLVGAHREELMDLLVLEVGKPRDQAEAELGFTEGSLRYIAEWDRRLEGEILAGDAPGESIHIERAPLGVVSAICPWNFPLAVLSRKLAPALLTGNTIVVKPSEVTPLSTLAIFRLIHDNLDLPPGVINLVTGDGRVGAAMVSSPTTAMVSFTGHRDTGKRISAVASEHLTRVSVELGGKAPAIVWRDADLDLAVAAVVKARHTNNGQVCTAAERVIVHNDLLETFTERYVAAVESLVIGDPAGSVDVGPLVNAAQRVKTADAVALAVKEGAQIVSGGGIPEGAQYERGYWYRPTVLRNVDPSMTVMREETFGPVTPIVGVDTIDEAVALANDSRYGLSAYLFSTDYSKVMQSVDALQFGEIYVNRSLGESVHAHHSGFKESGIGGEDGKWGLTRYTQLKTVYHHYGVS